MADVSPALLAANLGFYTALSLADFNSMERVWLASPDAVCIHPGWPDLHGWAAIGESWREIFRNQGPLRVWPRHVGLRRYGLTAEVNCLENIDMNRVRGASCRESDYMAENGRIEWRSSREEETRAPEVSLVACPNMAPFS